MRDRIKKVIKDTFSLDYVPDDISRETCVDWDSMNHLQLLVGLEMEFGVSFEPEDIVSIKTLDDIETKIKSLSVIE